MTGNIRSFLAIELTDEVKEKLADLRAQLDLPQYDVRWVRAQNMHLTLRFLGEIPEEMLDVHGFGFGYAVRDAMSRSTSSPKLPFRSAAVPVRKPTTQSDIADGDSVCEYNDAPNLDEMRTGTHVMHDKFGRGRIMGMVGYGEKAKAVVHFDSVGVKTLMLKAAKLTILNG